MEYTFSSLEDLGFTVINVEQTTVTRKDKPREAIPLFLFTITGNVKSQEISKLKS
jgi:hypothetical protein